MHCSQDDELLEDEESLLDEELELEVTELAESSAGMAFGFALAFLFALALAGTTINQLPDFHRGGSLAVHLGIVNVCCRYQLYTLVGIGFCFFPACAVLVHTVSGASGSVCHGQIT